MVLLMTYSALYQEGVKMWSIISGAYNQNSSTLWIFVHISVYIRWRPAESDPYSISAILPLAAAAAAAANISLPPPHHLEHSYGICPTDIW